MTYIFNHYGHNITTDSQNDLDKCYTITIIIILKLVIENNNVVGESKFKYSIK